MEDFSSTGQLVTLGLVDSSIGAMAKGLAPVDVEASIPKELLCSNLIGHLLQCRLHIYLNSYSKGMLLCGSF